ncbi:MAG: glycosyl hydrolase family 18 protein, partial [Clostridia bacterium]|nr:glycosyl hydrolase family 18 protein [Clostridia bacterium]
MSEITLTRRPGANKWPGLLPLVAVALVAALAGSVYYFSPMWQKEPLHPGNEPVLFYKGDAMPAGTVAYEDDELYVSFSFITEEIDRALVYDASGKTVIITTRKNVYHLPLGSKDGWQNFEPYVLTYPAIEKEGVVYLPADPLKDFYDLELYEDKDAGLIRIYDRTQPMLTGQAVQESKLRKRNSLRSPWTANLAAGETFTILKEAAGWYWVETTDGRMGYLAEANAQLGPIDVPAPPAVQIYPPWNPLSKPIIMSWEYAEFSTVNPAVLGELGGLQVLSPTWFSLSADGVVLNRADKKYVDWAHQNGRQVWGLFSNSFDPALTHAFLHDTALRSKAIRQILSLAELYNLDGINLDFENMYLQDKAAYVQFVRELAPPLHAAERLLTVDVTFHSKSENWSLCYDRAALAESADYLMIMGYDEHGAGSSAAGSVSSLPWVEKGLQKMLEEVPAEKLILGVPFYTRLWTETTDAGGKKELRTKAYSMTMAQKWLAEHKAKIRLDEETGQNYAEVKSGNVLYRMWLEDEHSLCARIELIKKYRLAGLAAWRRGYEPEE